jgi:hypothetical protein
MRKLFSAAVLSLFFALAIISCKNHDDENPQPKPQEKTCYVKKVVGNDSRNFYIYIYNSNMLIDSMISYSDSTKFSTNKYIYNSSGKISRIETFHNNHAGNITAAEYNADNTIKIIRELLPNADTSQQMNYTTFTYNAAKLPVEAHFYGRTFMGTVEEMYYITYTWNNNGDITRAEQYEKKPAGNYELTITTDYEYDNKTNAFQNAYALNNNLAYSYSKHNITRETAKDNAGGNVYTISIDHTYTPEGNVSSQKTTFSSQGSSSSYNGSFEYMCK